jgi:hypothetical protein
VIVVVGAVRSAKFGPLTHAAAAALAWPFVLGWKKSSVPTSLAANESA